MSRFYDMTPKEIVAELDKYIIGQESAKKSVAVALRNRYRRNLLPEKMKEEITPKNIRMRKEILDAGLRAKAIFRAAQAAKQ